MQRDWIVEYNGPPDPLHGNIPYLAVRKTAKVCNIGQVKIIKSISYRVM